jgi:hypothetical protein
MHTMKEQLIVSGYSVPYDWNEGYYVGEVRAHRPDIPEPDSAPGEEPVPEDDPVPHPDPVIREPDTSGPIKLRRALDCSSEAT